MRTQRRNLDDGFSLIEVIIAMVMIGIVASSALWFFINGMRTSSNLGRQQTAVSVASSAMEETFVVSPLKSPTAGVSGLVVGRSASAVSSALTAVNGLGIAGLSNSYALYDPAGGTPVVPITKTVNRAGVDYTVYTFVGSCYRTVTTNGAAEQCDKVDTNNVEPSTPPSSKVRLLRITVVVTWTPLGDECTGKCHYDVSTLSEPSADLVWNRVFDPEAVDDVRAFVPYDVQTTLVPLGNDWMASVPVNPASLISGLPGGTGTLGTFTSTGTIDYKPLGGAAGTWKSGIYTFTYQIRDIPGKTSQGLFTIQLLPFATDDLANATNNIPTVINWSVNDQGSPVTVNKASDPAHGTVTTSGTTLTYTPNAAGIDKFSYTYTDAAGQTSPPAEVTVNVAAASISDVALAVPYRSTSADSLVDISATLRGSGGNGASINILGPASSVKSGATAGDIYVDGVLYTGGTLTGDVVLFQPPTGGVGQWKFPFSMTVGTFTTSTANATMQVAVKASSESSSVPRKSGGSDTGKRTIVVGGNDNPQFWTAGSGVTIGQVSISSGCGSWTNSSPNNADNILGQLAITVGTSTKTGCKAVYSLTAPGTAVPVTATLTYNIT